MNVSSASFMSTLYDQTIGCFTKIEKLIDDNIVIIGGVALGIAALEVRNPPLHLSVWTFSLSFLKSSAQVLRCIHTNGKTNIIV